MGSTCARVDGAGARVGTGGGDLFGRRIHGLEFRGRQRRRASGLNRVLGDRVVVHLRRDDRFGGHLHGRGGGGGQYAQAKHIVGPLMAFNVALYLVLAYTMLEAGNAFVAADLLQTVAAETGHPNLDSRPFVLLVIVVLFFGTEPFSSDGLLRHSDLLTGLPYGWIGVIASLQFGMWYYLGIEGTCQAAEECRSAGRSIPLGTMTGMITLIIGASLTWYVTASLMPWEYLGQAYTPLYDAAILTGNIGLQVFLFVGTLFSTLISVNGCINDAARAWFSLGRDRYMPQWFGAVHPRYHTPFRSILFLIPIAVVFAWNVRLDGVITFSILSGLLGYTFMSLNVVRFRRLWPLGSIKRGYVHPFHPIPAAVLFLLCLLVFFATFLGYAHYLISILVFFMAASAWFHLHRYKFVKRGEQFTMPWPRPHGY